MSWIQKPVFKTAVSAICAVVLVACSDPKTASEGNFTKAAQSYYDGLGRPLCISIFDIKAYPAEVRKRYGQLHKLDALVGAGLLRREPVTLTISSEQTGDVIQEDGWRYELTPEGQNSMQPASARLPSNVGGAAFCFGNVKVNSVRRFSQPSTAGGHTTATVHYTYKIAEIPNWVKNQQLQTAFVELGGLLVQDSETAMMVLTDNGWVHSKLVTP